jgi:hypothetical protein
MKKLIITALMSLIIGIGAIQANAIVPPGGRHGAKDAHHDRREIRHDKNRLHHDVKEGHTRKAKHDARDLHRDKKDLRHDRRGH